MPMDHHITTSLRPGSHQSKKEPIQAVKGPHIHLHDKEFAYLYSNEKNWVLNFKSHVFQRFSEPPSAIQSKSS